MKHKVLIVEDEPAIAQEIAFNLEDHGFEVVGIAHSGDEALEMLYKRKPDIALLDISIVGTKSGIDIAKIINKNYKIPFVYLTSFADEHTIGLAAETYPEGYIVKPFKDDDLAPAIRIALMKSKRNQKDGFPFLDDINKHLLSAISPAEYGVVELIWKGKRNQEIADELFISINTVKSHLNHIYQKLSVNTKPMVIQKLRNM